MDDANSQSCRPDFAVLVYPAYLRKENGLAPELPVTSNVPPTLLVHNEDDKGFVPGTKIYHAALNQAKVPNSFLLYQTGGQRYGLRAKPEQGVYVWPRDCTAWLAKMNLCAPPVPADREKGSGPAGPKPQ